MSWTSYICSKCGREVKFFYEDPPATVPDPGDKCDDTGTCEYELQA